MQAQSLIVKSSSWGSAPCNSMYFAITSSVTFPLVATKYPPAHRSRPQNCFLSAILRLKKVNPRAEIVLYLYTPVPLSGELYDEARDQGFCFPETLQEWVSPEWVEFTQRRSLRMPWLRSSLRRKVWNFESVLNAYYPTATDARLGGPTRWLLRSVSAWRYHLRFYHLPLELRALHKLVSYRRPETSGF